MATEIRRSLYIGLGGTGMSTLLSTKRFFIETYGEVPPMIGFLGIDADRDFFNNTTINSKAGKLSLYQSEFCPIIVENALPIYKRYRNQYYNWLPEENINSLTGLTGDGCGQIRSNGRFSFFQNYDVIERSIQNKLNSISDATITDNPKYSIISGGKIDIHIVFSLAGGTGCGIFLDLAYLIKNLQNNTKTNAYAVLPDIFDAFLNGPSKKLIFPNAYGALSDLDYFMHKTPGKNGLVINYPNGRTIEVDEPPFRNVVLIDNKNSNGDTYTNIYQITEMLGIALATSAGKFSTADKTAMDNVKGWISEGHMDVGNKMGWTTGIGISEIQFDGLQLADTYKLKATRNLIQKIISKNPSIDINSAVNQWIDSPEVKIREDQDQDNVIDAIIKRNPEISFSDSSIQSNHDPKSDVDNYLNSDAIPSKEFVDSKIKELLAAVSYHLYLKLSEEVKTNFGLGNSLYFLEELLNQINVFLKEMNNELRDFRQREAKIEAQIKVNIEDLIEAANKPWYVIGRNAKLRDSISILVESVKQNVIDIREIIRRESAITFYSGLKNKVIIEHTSLKNLLKTLQIIDGEIGSELNRIQIAGTQKQTFVINLHDQYSKSLNVNNDEIDVFQFTKTLPSGESLYNLHSEKKERIKELIINYTNGLEGCLTLRNLTVEDVLKELSVDDYKHTLNMAISKSKTLYSLNFDGYNDPGRHHSFIIGVPDNFNSILEKGFGEDYSNLEKYKPKFKEVAVETSDIEIVSTGSKHKIVIYRQEAAAPVFAISGLKKYKEKYQNIRKNCHFDSNILQTMQLENFNLYPKDSTADDSIELWVKSIIFGYISNENGLYFIKTKNPKLTDAFSNYKYQLNTESNRREQAFEKFKLIKDIVKEELINEINNYINDKGDEFIKNMKTKFKNGSEYIHEDLAQVKMSNQWVNEIGQKDIKKLLLKEINFIENTL